MTRTTRPSRTTELACPNCGGPLDPDAGSLTCEDCQAAAPRSTYKARTWSVDAGAYSFQFHTNPDGGIGVAVLHISASRGSVDTVCYLRGHADAADGAPLLTVADAYDATNSVRIAPGGGRA